ncbi:MAG: fused response regulator/phosphatase [Thermodesulfobacteriota bacterium]
MVTEPSPRTILAVEDNPVNRTLITALLRKEGYRVLEAENGRIALQLCDKLVPDLVLLDISMPEMDGFEVLEALQNDHTLASIPVIMLTTIQDTDAKTRAFSLGAVDYITKPFVREEVLARIKTHLSISSLTHSLHEINRELLEKQETLLSNLHAAAAVQENLLPDRLPDCPGFRFASYFEPSHLVGGDLYNITELSGGEIGIYVLDVSGHGASAAMMAALVSQALSPASSIFGQQVTADNDNTSPSPGHIFATLNNEFPIERFNLYFTIFFFQFNPETRNYRYSCGGHPPAFLLEPEGNVTQLDKGGPMIGLGKLGPGWQEGSGRLGHGERVYFYSDGLFGYPDKEGNPFGKKRLIETLESQAGKDLDLSVEGIMEKVMAFGDHRPSPDDITLVAMECDEA